MPAQQRADARLEFADFEGLDQVVIGAGIQARQLVVQRVACGEHQQRRVAPGLVAQLAADGDAVHSCQHHVCDDDVVGVRYGEVQSRDAIGRVIDGVAARLEVLGDHLGDVAVILDQQQGGRGGFGSQGGSARAGEWVAHYKSAPLARALFAEFQVCGARRCTQPAIPCLAAPSTSAAVAG